LAELANRNSRTAPVLAILRAVGLASYRELRTFDSITGQNFFYLVLLIALQPESAEFFGLLIGAGVRGVHPNMTVAYREIAFPAAVVAGVIALLAAIVLEIRHPRRSM